MTLEQNISQIAKVVIAILPTLPLPSSSSSSSNISWAATTSSFPRRHSDIAKASLMMRGCRQKPPPSEYTAGDNTYGYIVIAIALFGVLGNLMNMIVLSDKRHDSATLIYLLFLSAANFLAMLNYSLDTLANLPSFSFLDNPYFYCYVIWPIGSLSSTWSLITAVSLVIDRFCFVDYLTKVPYFKSSKKRAICANLWIWTISIVLSLPRMLAVKLHDEYDCVSLRWNTPVRKPRLQLFTLYFIDKNK